MKSTHRLATVSLSTLISLGLLAVPAGLAQAQPSSGASDHSGPMQRADKDMRRVLEKLEVLIVKPLGTASVEETRKGPTPADAVKALLKDEGQDPDALMAQIRESKWDISYSSPAGD